MARDHAALWLAGAAAGVAIAAWGFARRAGDIQAGEPAEIGPDALPGPLASLLSEVTTVATPILDPRDAQAQQGNLSAFLDMIGASEGASYNTLFGGGTFSDYSTHPALAGWPGLQLSDAQCAGAGFGPGCVSTAAGKYQINRPTWRTVQAALSLPDFSPASQDRAAQYLLQVNGALDLVTAGRFTDAVNAVRKVWASLPGAGYGQHENALAQLEQVYVNAGGTVSA